MDEKLQKELNEISTKENLTLSIAEDLKEVVKIGGTFRIKAKLHKEDNNELSAIYETATTALHETYIKLADYLANENNK